MLPLIRMKSFYPGQMGVRGSDVPLGLRTVPDATVLYVDSGHLRATDDGDGTDPDEPKATVQSAVDSTFLTPNSYIVVSDDVAESVITPDSVNGPNYVTIMAAGPSRYGITWASDAADAISLDMRAIGWKVQGFRFTGNVSAAAVELRYTDSNANDIAARSVIDDCCFDGLTTGLAGIITHGAYDVWIKDCVFSLWNNGGNTAAGMNVGATPTAIPFRNHIVDCHFYDNDNNCIWPMTGGLVRYCSFQSNGAVYTAVQSLNTNNAAKGGHDNMVFGNFFEGDYSITGGYRGGTNDFWMGNFSDDTAEVEVDTTTGLTLLIPGA